MSRAIHSRDAKWIGKTWAEFYKLKMVDRASGYVDPEEDFQLDEEDQDIDEDESETEDDPEPIQVGQHQAEEPTETAVGVLQEQESKLNQLNQFQEEQDNHLGQTLK